MITLSDYFKPYNPTEIPQTLVLKAEMLLKRVNGLLDEIKWQRIRVTSGYRDNEKNRSVGGAPKSPHTRAAAIDLSDMDGLLYAAILKDEQLLHRWGLWMEHKDYTRGWVHLDMNVRKERPIRVFIP